MTQNRPSRRRFPRIPSQYEVGVRKAHERKSIPIVSTVNEMGLGGCRFVSRVSFGEGTLLWLTIIPKKSIVEAKAKVLYELPKKDQTFEIGVEFVEISPRDKATLEKILAPQAAQPGG